jgi:hypothetical protein
MDQHGWNAYCDRRQAVKQGAAGSYRFSEHMMPRPGWNPLRRNRNLGTAAQGHGQDNRMVIPGHWRDSRTFWERLTHFVTVTRPVHGRDLPFVVEPTRRDNVYACTVDDIARVLSASPARHVAGIVGVILRQPKRKEQILSPVWGRLGYAVEVGPIWGPAILVEAQPIPLTVRRPTRCDSLEQQELDCLRREADRVEFTGRHHVLTFGLEAVRAVQLYRTVLHELGHWAQYHEQVQFPSRNEDVDRGALWAAYRRRPVSERESFAHRYSLWLADELKRRGHIPFERLVDPKRLAAEGLSPRDFLLEAGPAHTDQRSRGSW